MPRGWNETISEKPLSNRSGDSFSVRIRVDIENQPGGLGRLTTAIGDVGGQILALDLVEVTGTHDKVEAFERMVRPFGMVEMARTGEIALSRGRGET